MRRAVLLALLVATGVAAEAAVDPDIASLRRYATRLVNRDRALRGLPALVLDRAASSAADRYCATQIDNGTTGHYTTDGLPPYLRYTLAGADAAVSENTAGWSAEAPFTQTAIRDMVRRSHEAMMAEASPGDSHKRTILDPHATHIGIGTAWEGGEFRLVQLLIRRWITWSERFPLGAHLHERVTARGKVIGLARVHAITVHHEPLPAALTVAEANARTEYTLPEARREYLPRAAGESSTAGAEAVLRSAFPVTRDGSFEFTVPFVDGPGIYTVVVWMKRRGHPEPFAASNVSIRVERAPAPWERGARTSR